MRRWLGGTCALVVACSLVAALTGPAARAATEDRLVAPGVEYHAFTRGDAAGPQEIRVLRVHPGDDPHLRIAPILASDTGARRAKVTDLVASSGAIAAVNGNFFTPNGDIRGIAVTDGVLRSEPEAPLPSVATPRAAWRVDGPSVSFGKPSSHLGWHRGDLELGINGIERFPGYLGNLDEAVLDTPRFGPVSPGPTGAVEVVFDQMPPLRANTATKATVTEMRSGPGLVPPNGAVISATGRNAQQINDVGVRVGDEITVNLDLDDPSFATAKGAGSGGPWLVRANHPVPRGEMLGEGFSPAHLDQRAPRTAIGRTVDGTVLLVTVDGRQPGRSVGTTLAGLAQILIEQGAWEAIALDGGGSTTMSVDGRLMNLPSGEDSNGQIGVQAAVTDAVGVFYDLSATATRRIAGSDRVATAIQLSQERTRASTVVLATTAGFADALVGAPLAAALGAPVLLTGGDHLEPRVAAEIRRLGATTAVLLGGTTVLGDQLRPELGDTGVTAVKRLAGADRYETAAVIARALGAPSTVIVASGERFPDALAAGALGLPVLLTTSDGLPPATAAAIGDATPVVVGGPRAISPDVLRGSERIAGADRYATSARIVDWGIAHGRYDDSRILVARGEDYPDALVGGPFRRPLLLVAGAGLDDSPSTRDWLRAHGPDTLSAVLLGGRGVLSSMAQIQVEQAVSQGRVLATVPGDLAR